MCVTLPAMNLLVGAPLWQLAAHTSIYGFAVVVSVSCATLFSLLYFGERSLRTGWRAGGFWLVASAYTVWVLAPQQPTAIILALGLELLGQLAIYYGVLREPLLTVLRHVPTWEERTAVPLFAPPTDTLHVARFTRYGFPLVAVLMASAAVLLPTATTLWLWLGLVVISTGIAHLQLHRYRVEDGSVDIHRQNLLPISAYGLLIVRALVLAATGLILPALITNSIALVCLFFAMLCLAWWAWIFIRIRPTLRTLIATMLAIAIGGTLAVFATATMLLTLLQALISGRLL